jgi:hypothetical protein
VGVSATHINDILAGRTFRNTDLCYDILKYLNAESANIFQYFPPAGKRMVVPAKQNANTREPHIVRIGAILPK